MFNSNIIHFFLRFENEVQVIRWCYMYWWIDEEMIVLTKICFSRFIGFRAWRISISTIKSDVRLDNSTDDIIFCTGAFKTSCVDKLWNWIITNENIFFLRFQNVIRKITRVTSWYSFKSEHFINTRKKWGHCSSFWVMVHLI